MHEKDQVEAELQKQIVDEKETQVTFDAFDPLLSPVCLFFFILFLFNYAARDIYFDCQILVADVEII